MILMKLIYKLTINFHLSKDDILFGWRERHSLLFPQLSLLEKSLFGVPVNLATSEHFLIDQVKFSRYVILFVFLLYDRNKLNEVA
jgi:hypothetical protein